MIKLSADTETMCYIHDTVFKCFNKNKKEFSQVTYLILM